MFPELGRFLQADPTGFKGDASNLYRYCGNNAANSTDPDGLGFQVTIAGGYRGWGGLISFGHNSGQWNGGAYGIAGNGFSLSVDTHDSGQHAPGFYPGFMATMAQGTFAGYQVSASGNQGGFTTKVEGNVLLYNRGGQIDLKASGAIKISSTPGSFGFNVGDATAA